MPQAAPISKSDVFVKLSETDEVVFDADPRFLLQDEASVLFVVKPDWKAPGKADKIDPLFGACMLQIGTGTSPGSILDVRVALDLQSITVASGSSKAVQVKIDCRHPMKLGLFFSNSRLQVWPVGEHRIPPQGFDFGFGGDKDDPVVPQIRLGGGGGKKPFSGIIGGVILFDRDILADLQSASADPRSAAFEKVVWLQAWLEGHAPMFFQLAGAQKQASFAKSLVGVAIPSQKRFDFFPRKILWPEGRLNRWMLHHGDGQPVKVQLSDADNQNDHGVYTTNTVYCFLRLNLAPPGSAEGDYPFTVFPCLFADSGLKFLLTYLGNNQFQAQTPDADQHSMLLTYNPSPSTSSKLATMEVECIGWDNTATHTFATQVCPPGASLPGNVLADTLYPRDLQFTCQPAVYSGADGGSHAERWDSAFAKNQFEYGTAMHGWDITAIDNPLNPLASRAGGKNASQYILNLPTADDAYRKSGNVATPYYLAAKPIWETSGTDMTQMFRSASECSHKQSFSFGVGASLEAPAAKPASGSPTPGLDFSFESVRQQNTKYSEEHTIATSSTVHFAFATMLEKQWLELSSTFVEDLKRALSTITSTQIPAPAEQYERLNGVFDYWGTHYANAVTFGFGEYSVGLIDDLGASSMTSNSQKITAGAKIPVEEVLVKADVAWSNEDSTTNETGSRSELYSNQTIGKEENAVPIRMDLRPITDLLVPPYMEDWALRKREHISYAINQYIQDRKQQPLDGFALYQARLVSIKNTNPDPCYISARVFLAGTQPNKLDIELPVGDKGKAKSLRLWYGDKLRIDANSTYTVPLTDGKGNDIGFASVGIPLSRTDLGAAICVTGFTFNPVMSALHYFLPDKTGYVTFSQYPSLIASSDQRVKAALDDMLSKLKTVDQLGVDWFDWKLGASYLAISPLAKGWGHDDNNYSLYEEYPDADTTLFTLRLLQAKQNFPALSGNGTIQQLSLQSLGLELVFQVRKVDLVDCFGTKRVDVAPLPPPPTPKAAAV